MNNSDSITRASPAIAAGGSCDTNLSFQRTIPPLRQLLLAHKTAPSGLGRFLIPRRTFGRNRFGRERFVATSSTCRRDLFYCLARDLISALFFVSLRTRFLSCHSTVFAKIRFQFLERYLFPRYPGTGWCCCQRRGLCL